VAGYGATLSGRVVLENNDRAVPSSAVRLASFCRKTVEN